MVASTSDKRVKHTNAYMRAETLEIFKRIAEHDDRSIVSTMDVAAQEAAERRGLTPKRRRAKS